MKQEDVAEKRMARFSINKIPEPERIRLIGEFYNAIGTIKDRDEAAKVCRDLFDGNEIGNTMRRIDVAILLMLDFTYEEISKLLGVGKNKISNVHKKLERGGEGYKILIKRILGQRKERKIRMVKTARRRQRQREKGSFGFEEVKRKYPGAFLLWHIVDEFGDALAAHEAIKESKEEAEEYYRKNKK